MKRKTTRFLAASLAVLVILSTSIMVSYNLSLNKKSERIINEVGTIYMSGTGQKIAQHFGTTISLRINQIGTIIKDIPPKECVYGNEMLELLEKDGKIREFDYLGLYDEDGNFDMIYGDDVTLYHPEPFYEDLKNGSKKVSVAYNTAGEKVLLIGVPISYPMKNGGSSLALVAGLPIDYISEILSLDKNDSLTNDYIIRKDGSYVTLSPDKNIDNYFDRIKNQFSGIDEKSGEKYTENFKKAMEYNEDFSSVVTIGKDRRHVFATPLQYSEWYLVIIMPYGQLDETINSLSNDNLVTLICSVAAMFAIILIIFIKYFKMTQKQISATENARKEAIRASKAKSEFLSNMSHDIRTPMNAIVGMTAIAAANINDKQKVENCLKKITISSKHLLGLINDILDMSTIESGKMTLNTEMVSLREIVSNIVNIVQPQIKAKHQHFDVFIHNIDEENVYCDSLRLNQVLINFLSNAIKFTPDGGNISISLNEENSPKGKNFTRVNFYIKDTGIGMTQEFQKTIFDSFAREDNKRVHKTEGSGLGMAIAKYIVDSMGGAIYIKSEPNKGSEFHVVLDFEIANIKHEDMLLPNWNMLLVDDDEELCESAASSLKSIGLAAEYTFSGESALAMVNEHHVSHNDYKIVLLDWQLPGMDGIETAREIRREVGEDVPILLISAYDWSDIENEARQAGVNGFISKPLFKSTLYCGLKPYMESPESASSITEGLNISFSGERILVAEDNDINWEIANELLSQLALVPEHAENGKVCVDMFNNSPVGYYSAILMDIRMPVMTGYEASDAIRKLPRVDSDIPILAMTADAFAEDAKRCLQHGMNAHIAKPIDIKEVARLIDKFIK